MLRRAILVAAVSLTAACGSGGGPPETRESPAEPATAGDEQAFDEPVPEVTEESAQDESAVDPAPDTGPSTITVKAEVNGKPAKATIHLLAGKQAVDSVETGSPLTVDSGQYTMVVEIGEDSLVDRPTQERALTLLPGGKITETVEFPWAMIQLNVRINGKLDRNATVDVMRDGAVVATFKSGAKHVPISPGRYEAEVHARGAKIKVKQLMFPQGATQTVPVDVSM